MQYMKEMLDKESKGKDYTLVMGDWNAVVGEGKEVYRRKTCGVLQT